MQTLKGHTLLDLMHEWLSEYAQIQNVNSERVYVYRLWLIDT